MPVYKDKVRNTWFVKFQYKNWEGERKWITKRGFSTKREAAQWEREFEFTKIESSDIPFDSFIEIYKAPIVYSEDNDLLNKYHQRIVTAETQP